MLEELFSRCVSELCSEQFDRLAYLKSAAELAPNPQAKNGLLVLHSLYLFLYGQQFKKCLECIQHGLSLKPEDAIKGMILGHMDKHSESLHSLKEAFSVAQTTIFIQEQPHIRKIYPQLISKILSLLNITRGRREFLVFLQSIRVQSGNLSSLEEVERIASMKVGQIRQLMRCGCRQESQGLTMQSNQFSMAKKQGVSHTSIYINKLYEERKMALGKRDNSSSKKKTYDPSDWRIKEKQSKGECQYM